MTDVSTIVDTVEKAAIRLDNRKKTFSKLPYTETERKLEQGTLTIPPGRLIADFQGEGAGLPI